MLYPQNNQCRTVQSLNGIWKYDLVSDSYRAETALSGDRLMAVPASINEIVTDAIPRDYVGRVAFETEIEASVAAGTQKMLYIGSTGHRYQLYVNGQLMGESRLGFLPMEFALPETLFPHLRVTVVDDRADLVTQARFPTAEHRICDSYEHLENYLEEDAFYVSFDRPRIKNGVIIHGTSIETTSPTKLLL